MTDDEAGYNPMVEYLLKEHGTEMIDALISDRTSFLVAPVEQRMNETLSQEDWDYLATTEPHESEAFLTEKLGDADAAAIGTLYLEVKLGSTFLADAMVRGEDREPWRKLISAQLQAIGADGPAVADQQVRNFERVVDRHLGVGRA